MNTTSHCPTPSSEESERGRVPGASLGGIDLRVSLVRGPARLPWRAGTADARDELPASDVLRAARAAAGRPGAFLVGGGDPLRRADLSTLLHDLSGLRPENVGLSTAGAGVTSAAIDRLRSAGVQRLTVPFHCARRDAHDWLVGQPGALRTALRAIRTCVDAGMPVRPRSSSPGRRCRISRRRSTSSRASGYARSPSAVSPPSTSTPPNSSCSRRACRCSPTTWSARRRSRSSDGPGW